jgi:hypothetical protein
VISSTFEPFVGVHTKKPVAIALGPPALPWLLQFGPLVTAAGLELVSHWIGQGCPVASKNETAVG